MKKKNHTQKPNFTKLLAIIFCSHLIVAAIIITINNSLLSKKDIKKNEASSDFSYVKVALSDRINNIKQDIRIISNLIQSTTNNPHVEKDSSVIELFESMIETRKYYDQIRLLNSKGKEILRLNKSGDGAIKVAEDKLQDKSNRYYFTDIYSSSPDKFYISKLDWNIEADSVELPLKATIRIGIPIKLDIASSSQGVLLINYLAAGLVSSLTNTVAGEEYLVISQDGITAFNPNAANLLDSDHLFNQKYPDLWRVMQENKKGTFKSADHNYQYEKISFGNINSKSYSTIWLVKKAKVAPIVESSNSTTLVYFSALVLSFAFAVLVALILNITRREVSSLSDQSAVTA
ncbi:hypothetical protein H0A36_10190 [Endozoicomonas sp. SM1973]|uniref:Histidine kinase VP0354-like sensor domain-containing protein n=1 Tax=Spartinivicinus marinus TaxID=2994442 RepID=A0A853HXA6_9GAMM|nr:hypothetical protein [Spartinivicinus marinus]MCX4027448.1 hypothetical protein [Spartinivicinus marinus]NYZ66380.1 hypothetical protein [Spartinivicinus marinus]